MFHLGENILSHVSDTFHGLQGHIRIEGTVVLVKRNVLDLNDFTASVADRVSEVLGHGVGFRLISATVGDENRGNRGVVVPESRLENWITTLSPITPGNSVYNMSFYWDPKQGIPGAFFVENHHPFEFYLKTVTLRNVPNKGSVHFDCYSWVYNYAKYKYTRVFFSNETYVTTEIPATLKEYVDDELHNLRGDGVNREFVDGDRYYGYAVYNDLGYDRPVLGGSEDLPYPRRGRTGRPKYSQDEKYETTCSLMEKALLDIYVPRDERFGHEKMSDFVSSPLKGLAQVFVPFMSNLLDRTPLEFDSFTDSTQLYEGGMKLPGLPGGAALRELIPFEMAKEFVRSDGERTLRMPVPLVIQSKWYCGVFFGRT